MEEENTGPLFGEIVFSIIPDEELDQNEAHYILQTLVDGGARHVPLRAEDDQLDDIENLTHIISNHVDFPDYNRVLELGVHVVKPSWVAQSKRKKKQAATRQHSPDPDQYFRDVVLTCAEIPEGDAEAITAGVIALGGQHTAPLTKLVTHIVTTDLDNDKCQIVEDKGLKVKIVLPHWFDDCLRLGKKISERPYEFPDPEILRRGNTAHVKPTASGHLEGAITASPSKTPNLTPPPSPSKNRKNLNAFFNRKLFFAQDLELSEHFQTTLTKLINHGGGIITEDLDEADIFIGFYRDGKEYVAASQAGKEVANLSWLYHVINRNKYTSPLRKLFHYPVPRDPIDGFENMKISLSNYAGDARTYVENLIRACGAEYTKTMKQDNSYLITAHKHGEKCDAAAEWGVSMVNHLWLEESYAKSAMQNTTNPKYTYFPVRTNLGEVTGQTSLDMKSMEKKYFAKPRSPQKPTPRKALPASSAVKNRAALQDEEHIDIPMTNADVDEMDVEQDAEPKTVKKPRGRPSRSSIATPRVADEEKENESPLLTSTGRAAKSKALHSLHSQAPDINLFQKEMKRKGGVTHGGRRPSRTEENESPAPARSSRKRPSDEYDVTKEGSDLSDGETQDLPAKQAKKAKHGPTAGLPPVEYRLMLTGDGRWTDNAKKESADKAALRGLGVLLTQDPKDVDILVAPKILRTKKFVCALAGAPLVVETSFLDTALSKKKLVDNPPMLKDRETEEKYGFSLSEAIERAKKNHRKLFKDWAICVTKEVSGGFDTYKDIVSLNGGDALLYAGRTNLRFSKPAVYSGEDDFDYVYLVSGTSPAEVKLWKKFRDNAESQGLQPRVVSSDWVLNAAMSQQVEFKEKWSLDEEKVLSQRDG